MNIFVRIIIFILISNRIDSRLVNFWSFNQSIRQDEISNVQLFEAVNASLTEDRFGRKNSALLLNNGYIRIPPGVYLGSQFTITVWIKLKLKRHFSRIIEFGNGPYSDNIELSFRETTSYVHLKTYFQNETKGFLDSSSALNLNEWTHVAACLCSGTAKLYFNGILVASGTQYSPRNFIRKHNFIGKGSFEGDENANAIFDDIKIFDECLNDYEIKEDADKKNLIHYWSFNGSLINDEIGKANLLLPSGFSSILTKDRLEKPNSALEIEKGYIEIPPGVYFSGDFTITLWIKIISIELQANILTFGNGDFNDNIKLFLNHEFITMDITSQSNKPTFTISLTSIKLNEWTHITALLNENNTRIFINGLLTAYDFMPPDSMPKNIVRSSNRIGDLNNNNIFFDEIKIFNRALNQYEIEKEAQVYKKGPVHYWSFNGDLTRDEIGHAHLLNPVNASLTSDRFDNLNSALLLKDGYLTMPPRVYFVGDFTITAWVKLNSIGYYSRILDIGKGSYSENIVLSTYHTDSSYIGFFIVAGGKHNEFKSSAKLKLNKWTHIAAVLNGTKGYIYLNGILEATGVLLVPNNVTRYSSFVGKSNWAQDKNANAIYDEIKIFDRALNSFEILEDARTNNIIFNLTKKNHVRKVSKNDLEYYWSFDGNLNDEINGAELYDGFNAFLTNDRFDRPNSALSLENGYYKVPIGMYFNYEFTITFWIKLNSYRNSAIVNFGNDINDNVIISIDDMANSIIISIYDESFKSEFKSNKSLNLNQWNHLAIVFNKGKVDIYFNCTHDSSGPLYLPRSLVRMNNYIGKSNFASYKNAHACLDELKIYKRALDLSQLVQDMNPNHKINNSERNLVIFGIIIIVILIIISTIVFILFRNKLYSHAFRNVC